MTNRILTRLQEIREFRAQRRALRRELSSYTTVNDLNDIEAAVSRYAAISRSEDPETDPIMLEIRRTLAFQRYMFQ